jgi:hypothetical protein
MNIRELINEEKERCPQCGMTDCTCAPGKCKCKPIAGWIPNKGFKKDIDEAVNPAQQAAIAIAKKKKKGMAEDHEVAMATSELMNVYINAKKLFNIIKRRSEDQGLDAWQQSKITKASDYLNSVLTAIRGEPRR